MRYIFILIILFCFNVFGDYYLTESGAGAKDGSSWDNAWSLTEFETFVEAGSGTAGVTIWCKSGTYTLTSAIIYNRDSKLRLRGVVSSTTNEPAEISDYAYGDDRPLFACGSYNFNISQYGKQLWNLRFSGAYNGTMVLGYANPIFNIKIENTYNNSTATCLAITSCNVIYSEFISTYGRGLEINAYSGVEYSTFRDSSVGIYHGTNIDGTYISNNIIYNNSTGIVLYTGTGRRLMVSNNTIYNCTTGMDANSNSANITNNMIVTCTNGIADNNYGIIAGNNFYNCTNNTTGTITHLDYSTLDPQFVDAANGDFTPQNKALIGETYPTTFIGTSTANKSVAGAVQFDASASGGGEHTYINVN